MKRLVNEFRDYARLPAADLKPVDLNALVTDVLHLYDAESTRDRRVHTELDERCPPHSRRRAADAAGHSQPAAERAGRQPKAPPAAPAAVGEVAMRTRLGDSGQRVRLTVQDSGPGFAENILKRAFEPYVTTKAKGTGLGLAVVKKIADEHGARIELSNRIDGRGCGRGPSLVIIRAGGRAAGAVAHTEDSRSIA